MGYMDKIWTIATGPIAEEGPTPTPFANKKLAPTILIPGALERSQSMASPPTTPSPSPSSGGEQHRRSSDFAEPRKSASQKITIHGSDRRPSLDSSRSLPTGFHLPLSEILSPGSRRADENVWRSVFHPGSNKSGMDRLGSAKFDKAGPGSPSVYDWYNPIS